MGPYLQHSIFFITYDWARQGRVLHYTRLDKHSSLLGAFVSNEENKVLWIRTQRFITLDLDASFLVTDSHFSIHLTSYFLTFFILTSFHLLLPFFTKIEREREKTFITDFKNSRSTFDICISFEWVLETSLEWTFFPHVSLAGFEPSILGLWGECSTTVIFLPTSYHHYCKGCRMTK